MKSILAVVVFSVLVASCTRPTFVTPTPYSVLPDCNSYCDLAVGMNGHLFVFPPSFDGFDFFCAYETDSALSTSKGDKRWEITFEYRRKDKHNQRLKLSLSNALGMEYQPLGNWKGTLTKNEVVLSKYTAKYKRLLAVAGTDYCSLFWHVGDVSMLLTLDVCDMGADDMAALTNNLVPVSQATQMCESTPSVHK